MNDLRVMIAFLCVAIQALSKFQWWFTSPATIAWLRTWYNDAPLT
jgi:hypothetical protein